MKTHEAYRWLLHVLEQQNISFPFTPEGKRAAFTWCEVLSRVFEKSFVVTYKRGVPIEQRRYIVR